MTLVAPLSIVALAGLLAATGFAADPPAGYVVTSPDGRIAAELYLDTGGTPRYTVLLETHPILADSRLGLVREDDDFSKGLRVVPVRGTEREQIKDDYELTTSKRRVNHYVANRRTVHLSTAGGHLLDVVFQVSNDGVAFRYVFPERDATVHQLKEEVTSFHFLPGSRAWLQPMSVAKTGWSQVNPCYEEFYQKDIPVGTPSPMAGWVYPALFRTGDTWIALTEGSLGRNYCGTRLRPESPDGEYTIGFPDPRENFKGGAVNPESALPWATPWRIVAVGSLKTIMESTLGTDLAEKPAPGAPKPGTPGKASWSWPLMGDDNTKYDVQKRFIDYAADMHWRYCLIDALWDKQIGYDKTKELVDYGRTKGVGILLWYNSAGDWCAAPQTPRDKMLTHESRIAEFDRLKQMGVAGLKIDFFGGDGESMINYYHDILADAAPYGLAMNFHGATVPRGWNRTYPQLMTMEGVRGFEYVTFEQANADEEPAHCCMLPFGRNLYDPMDFTPVAMDHINKIERRTTSAFELALSVVFTSGITHYAETPEGMAKTPDYVRDFLRNVPSVWDEVRFLDGFPGKHVVLARRGDGKRRWYVAGINGESEAKTLTLDLHELGTAPGKTGVLITDGDGGNLSFRQDKLTVTVSGKQDVTLKPRGGFVMVIE